MTATKKNASKSSSPATGKGKKTSKGAAPEAAPEPGVPTTLPEAAVPAASDEAPTAPAGKRRKAQAPTKAHTNVRSMGALDAAAKVLEEAGTPMNCKTLIGVMAMKGYWTSPNGKTPDATLYAALLKEITTKGEAARFTKVGPGLFGLRSNAS